MIAMTSRLILALNLAGKSVRQKVGVLLTAIIFAVVTTTLVNKAVGISVLLRAGVLLTATLSAEAHQTADNNLAGISVLLKVGAVLTAQTFAELTNKRNKKGWFV
jgi:hypothetical protein